jgi:hypothetical protein
MLGADGEIMRTALQVSQPALVDFCKRHHIRRLSLFGSVLRDDFRPDSDVDVLVEFEPGQRAGYLRLAGLEIELSRLFGRKVDLRTAPELSRHFRDEVLATAEPQYVAR